MVTASATLPQCRDSDSVGEQHSAASHASNPPSLTSIPLLENERPMSEFRLSKPKKEKLPADRNPSAGIKFSKPKQSPRDDGSVKFQRKARNTETASPSLEGANTLLSKAGGAAVSGLHTIGSILSTPSRVLWGTINGLAGGEGGFGSMNPLDSTGGIELSHVLGNAGLISKNDPTKWEWSDFGRGLVDIAGDPTTLIAPLGLTKAGVAASKAGTLTKGLVNSIRAGERGLVGVKIPFAAHSSGAIGTGSKVADALSDVGQRTGLTTLANTVANSAPVVKAKQLMNAPSMGRSTAATQRAAEDAYDDITHGLHNVDLGTVNAARNMEARGPLPGSIERHLAELSRPTQEMAPVIGLKNALHSQAQSLGILTGTLDNDVKMFHKSGPKKARHTQVLDERGNTVRTIDNMVGSSTRDLGDVNYLIPNQKVEHFPRYVGEGVEWGNVGGDSSRRAMSASSSLNQHRNDELFGNASTALIEQGVRAAAGAQPRLAAAGLNANQQARALGKLIKKNVIRNDIDSGTNLTKKFADASGREMSRTRELGQFVQANPQVAETGLFTNHPLYDAHRQLSSLVDSTSKARAAIDFMAQHGRITHNEPLDVLRRYELNNPPTIRAAASKLGLEENRVADRILHSMDPATRATVDAIARQEARRLATHRLPYGSGARDIEDAAEAMMPQLLTQTALNLQLPAREYESLTGFLKTPEHSGSSLLSSLNTVWKANMLAHPATQVRNAVSGAVTNVMEGSVDPTSMKSAIDLLRGQELSGYDHLPDVANLMRSQGIDQTEALRRLSAVHFPSSHSIAGDLPPGQVGTTLADMVSNVPGREQIPLSEMVSAPARTLAGYQNGQHVGWNAINPAAIGGAFGHETTKFSPAATANMVAGNVEQANRISAWLGLMKQGYSAREAARKVGKAQVNYGPREFSEFEKKIKKVIPFYAFTSRAGKHVAGELATNPGGRLAQFTKAQDRSHSTDPTIPDNILSGTALPLADGPDGTKRFITGFGLQHEPIVHTLGALAGGDLRGAMYDVFGMTNPMIKTPLEHMTGQSFYQRGEPAQNLESNIGRTLSNLGVMAGLRDKEAGPVSFPGLKAIDTVVGASPLSRYAATARTLTDQRKTIGERLMNTTTGVKVSDVSPKKQAYELMKKAENLAKEEGGRTRSEVYFSKKELERLDKDNPQLAAKQRELQKLLNGLKSKVVHGGSIGSSKSGGKSRSKNKSKTRKSSGARSRRSSTAKRSSSGDIRTQKPRIRFVKKKRSEIRFAKKQ